MLPEYGEGVRSDKNVNVVCRLFVCSKALHHFMLLIKASQVPLVLFC